MTKKEPIVEIPVGERFQGGYCNFYNTPLPNADSCKSCIKCGKSKADGSLFCRIGAHIDC